MRNEKSILSTPLPPAEVEKDLVVPAYFTAYRSLRLTRDALGVLVAEFHSDGSPLTFTAPDHTDFVEADRYTTHYQQAILRNYVNDRGQVPAGGRAK